jgi:uncharacterized protein YjdB
MRTYGKLLAAALALSALPLLYACDGPTPPKPLSVSPVYTKVYVGQMVQLCATTFDGRDAEEALGEPVHWSSTDASVAEVTDGGWVRGLKPGNVTIAAGCRSHCGSARVMVAATDPGSHEMDPPGGAR